MGRCMLPMFGLQGLLKVGLVCLVFSCCTAPTLPINQDKFSTHASHNQLLQPVLAAEQQHFNPRPRGSSPFSDRQTNNTTVAVTNGSSGDAAEKTRLLAQFVLSNSKDLRSLFHRCGHFRDAVCAQHQRFVDNNTRANTKPAALSSNASVVLSTLLSEFGLDSSKVRVTSAVVQLLPPEMLTSEEQGPALGAEVILQRSVPKEERDGDVARAIELALHSSDDVTPMSRARIDVDPDGKVGTKSKSSLEADFDSGEPLARQFLRLLDERADERRSRRDRRQRRSLSSKNETNSFFRQVSDFFQRKSSSLFLEVGAAPSRRESQILGSRATLRTRASVSATFVTATPQVPEVVAKLQSIFQRRSSRLGGTSDGEGGELLSSRKPCFDFLECLAADLVLLNVSRLSP